MAGKSPDRSVRQISLGETTEGAGTVPERSRDPRAALCEAPREAEEPGTGPDAGERGTDGEGSGGPTATGEPGDDAAADAAASADADAGDDADPDTGVSADTDAGDGAHADTGADPDAEGADAEGAGDGGTSGGASADGDRAAGTGTDGEPGSGDGSADRSTTVLRAPAAGPEAEAGGPESGKDGPAEAGESTGPAAGGSGGDGGGKAEGAGGAASGEARDEDRDEAPEDGRDGTGTAAGPAAKPVDQTTAMLRVRPGGAGTGREEGDAERTSRFVPLRSPDDPRPSAPTPSAPPAAAAATTATTAPVEAPAVPELPEAERTKQQPLPPHRPLELLAELTNKPAPPPTPLRTALRRIKIWSPLVVLLAIVLAVVQLLRPLPEPELKLTAPAAYSFGGEKPEPAWPGEGQAAVEVEGLGSLGTYGEQKPVPIASVAKVMTAYVILREHPLKAGEEGPRIPVDQRAEKEASLPNESTVPVEAGEEITLSEALHAVMIASANNVARLLARWDTGGSEEEFVKKMNAAAKELGMNDTTYTDASGLRQDTVSTAVDQVKLGKKVMDFEAFREIVKKPSYDDRNGRNHRNWNGLVPYDNAIGIKPGTTTAAGGNLLFAGEKEIGGTRQLIIGAVLGQHRPSIIDTVVGESRELLVSVQKLLRAEQIVRKGDVVGYVDDGLGGRTALVATEDVTAVGWSGLEVELALTDGGKGVPGTAEAGETVGTLTVGSGPGQVKVPVAVREELAEPGVGTRLTRVL